MLRILRGVGSGLLVLAVAAAWLAVGAFGGMAQGRLSQVQTNDSAAFLPSSAESTRAAELSAGFTESESLPVLVVLAPEGGGALDPQALAAVQPVVEDLPGVAIPGADPAAGDPATIGDVLTGDPVVVPSEDGEALLVPLSLDADATEQALADDESVVGAVVQAVRDTFAEELGATADSAGETGLNAWVTGPGGFVADLTNAFGGIDGVLLLVALGAVLVILVLVYRSPFLPLAVILTAVFALCAAALAVYHLADSGALTLNGQAQGILSILVVGASVDYALLIVARYREELRLVERPAAAMRRALRRSLEPIAASAGTVVAGLLCLLLSDLASNRSLGPVGAIGIASAFLAAFTLLPLLLLVAGPRSRALFWPRIPRPHAAAHAAAPVGAADEPAPAGASSAGAHVAAGSARDPLPATGLWGRLARWVGRRDRVVWIATSVVLLACAAFVPTFQASGTSQADVFLTDVDSVAGEEVLAAHFPAGVVQPAVVVVDTDEADAVVEAALEVEGVQAAAPYTGASATGAPGGADAGAAGGTDAAAADGASGGDDAGAPGDEASAGGESAAGAPGAAPQADPVVVDGRVRVDVTTEAAADTTEGVATVGRLREAVHEVAPDALVGGAAAETLDAQDAGTRDLRVIVPVVLVVILLILMLLLRSVLAAVLLMLANVLSFAAALGVAALVFDHVLDFPGADPAVPLYAFTFLVALGVDYSIFLMTRVREESVRVGTRDGVLRGLAVTGGVITSAGVVLAMTFAALGVIPLLFLAQLAFIVAFGVLLDTLVVRSLLVPALVHDVGARTWWPSRLSRSPAGQDAAATGEDAGRA
ncbi:MMPL family transporter [Cellulomonas sp. C5510]|uniref:MMPL family transporter n=1 Tax=Cellulomonas sp. C5510 TaxID=2871170 RepID=UPI001C97F126|nr:MMPL family transporter [Cellulomonas sp. C5510]QZN87100.1 MMPL family transporter [Cellulomonas sp. C5510]